MPNYRLKYMKEGRIRRVTVEFYQKDAALWEWLQENKPAATYIKALLKADMERERP